MTADEWDRAEWVHMLRLAPPDVDGSRKLRLWCVAWARELIAAAPTHWPFEDVAGWFTPDMLIAYALGIDAAEAFADGATTRKQMNAAKPKTGGPYNVLHFPCGITRLTADDALGMLSHFTGEFGIPTGDRLAALLRDIFGNPFRPVAFAPEWRTDTAITLARTMYDSREFIAMPILADALQDAGCDNADILDHCRDGTLSHVRGCWVCDLVLGKA